MNTPNPAFRSLFLWPLILFAGNILLAQDIHYTMFNRAPINLNPGLVGVFGGDVRLTSNYRQQWGSVPVDYKTFTLTAEKKLFPAAFQKGFLTIGGHFNYDNAGDVSLQQVTPGVVASYVRPLSDDNRHFLSVGGNFAFTNRSFNTNSLQVDAQFNGDIFDPNLPTLEEGTLVDQRNFVSLGGGLNYRLQNPEDSERKRFRLDLGVGLFHLLRSNRTFNENNDLNNIRLQRRLSLYGITAFEVAQKWDVGVTLSSQSQGPHQEFVLGANVRKYFNKVSLLLGLGYRFGDGDALLPQINLDFQNFSFGFSYDLNQSDFDIATNGRGGPELSGIYTFGRPKVAQRKPCKIF
ncbi:MAG: PorP/SprF family type IX secretion system membrane protein [Bacteroidota bacterium]